MTLPTLSVDRTHTLSVCFARFYDSRRSVRTVGTSKQGAGLQRQSWVNLRNLNFLSSTLIGSSYYTKEPAK